MSIIRVGATKQYSDGWEAAFTKGKKKATATAQSAKKTQPAKKSAKKAAGKKPAGKKPAKKK